MWKQIKGTKYEVNENGEIRNSETGHIKKQRINKRGYATVNMYKDGKMQKVVVHRLVAEAFIPKEEGKNCVNHKDEDKTNNYFGNLEWCDIRYNNHYGTRQAKCDAARSKAVGAYKDGKLCAIYPSIVKAAEALGVNPTSIGNAIRHENYTHTCKGYEWRFMNNGLTARQAAEVTYKNGGGISR